MTLVLTRRAIRDYHDLPAKVRRAADKQLDLLLHDLRHPSLHAKKYDETRDIWQGRLTKGYRFYFQIEDDRYVILTLRRHPK